jgi:3-phenylpropionate/trans-cinnamate dioxygenase ferredoxin component
MLSFVEAAQVGVIPLGTGVAVRVANTDVALFNVDGTIYAINDSCAHAGSSLAAGELKGTMLRCRGHGMIFDVTNGFVNGVSGFGVASYPVRAEGGNVFVGIEQ